MTLDGEFESRNANPKFLCRDGLASDRGASCSQRKLCFTTTRPDLLAYHLFELSQREDPKAPPARPFRQPCPSNSRDPDLALRPATPASKCPGLARRPLRSH
jgi:hypothetical protein